MRQVFAALKGKDVVVELFNGEEFRARVLTVEDGAVALRLILDASFTPPKTQDRMYNFAHIVSVRLG